MVERKSQSSDQSSLLPIPWRNPWAVLREDLKKDLPAVFAQLRLGLQELWRRNSIADLPAPGFWPKNLKSYFWPFIIIAAILLLSCILYFSANSLPKKALVSELDINTLLNPESIQQESQETKLESILSIEQSTKNIEKENQPNITNLLEFLQPNANEPLIASLQPDPDKGILLLMPSDLFDKLTISAQQLQADDWLAQTRAMGFNELQLEASSGSIIGRSARVGQGMIMFNSINQ
jgi:hypothetical protein